MPLSSSEATVITDSCSAFSQSELAVLLPSSVSFIAVMLLSSQWGIIFAVEVGDAVSPVEPVELSQLLADQVIAVLCSQA